MAKSKAAKEVSKKTKEAVKPTKKVDAIEEPIKAEKPAAKSKKPSSDIIDALDRILEAELSGVVRYLHYSFMIFGPNRIPITKWFRDHAMEGIQHAVTIGEKITALGGHPSVKVQPVPETNKHNVMEILKESLEFEREGLRLYHELLEKINGDVALEEMVRDLILDETTHIEDVEKMTRALK